MPLKQLQPLLLVPFGMANVTSNCETFEQLNVTVCHLCSSVKLAGSS